MQQLYNNLLTVRPHKCVFLCRTLCTTATILESLHYAHMNFFYINHNLDWIICRDKSYKALRSSFSFAFHPRFADVWGEYDSYKPFSVTTFCLLFSYRKENGVETVKLSWLVLNVFLVTNNNPFSVSCAASFFNELSCTSLYCSLCDKGWCWLNFRTVRLVVAVG